MESHHRWLAPFDKPSINDGKTVEIAAIDLYKSTMKKIDVDRVKNLGFSRAGIITKDGKDGKPSIILDEKIAKGGELHDSQGRFCLWIQAMTKTDSKFVGKARMPLGARCLQHENGFAENQKSLKRP